MRMSDRDAPRPVSGEIVASGRESKPYPAASRDFTDAEFETVPQPHSDSPDRPRESRPVQSGMDSLRSPAKPATGSRPAGPLFWAVGALLALAAFWVSGGHALFDAGAIAGAQRGNPFFISGVESRIETLEGRAVLFVEGSVENRGTAARGLPDLDIAVTEPDGRTWRYFLGTNAASLEPGGRFGFSSRLEAPRNGVKVVSVSFQGEHR